MDNRKSERRKGYPLYPAYEQDEISLVDIFRLLQRRKALILVVATCVALLVAVYALSRDKTYNYSVNIDIGKYEVSSDENGRTQALDTPQNVQVNLTNAYIPKVLTDYYQDHPEDSAIYKIDAEIPRGSSIIRLKANGTVEQESIYKKLINQVVALLVSEHDKKLKGIKNNLDEKYRIAKLEYDQLNANMKGPVKDIDLQKQINDVNAELASVQAPKIVQARKLELENDVISSKQTLIGLKSQKEQLDSQIKRLDKNKLLIASQINDLKTQIAASLQQRQNMAGDRGNDTRAVAAMILDNEIQQDRNRLGELQERFNFGLEEQRVNLVNDLNTNAQQQVNAQQNIKFAEMKVEKFLADNDVKQNKLKNELALLKQQVDLQSSEQEWATARKKEELRDIENRMESVQPTSKVTNVITSLQPVSGNNQSILVVMGVLLGLMVGVFSAFIAEFLSRVHLEDTNELGLASDFVYQYDPKVGQDRRVQKNSHEAAQI